LEVALPNWSVKHLSLWSEIVEPETLVLPDLTQADVDAVEEVTIQARFQETMSKIA